MLDLRLLEYWNSLVSRGPFSPLQYRPVTIQCHTMQYNSMQCHTIPYSTIQCHTILFNTRLVQGLFLLHLRPVFVENSSGQKPRVIPCRSMIIYLWGAFLAVPYENISLTHRSPSSYPGPSTNIVSFSVFVFVFKIRIRDKN